MRWFDALAPRDRRALTMLAIVSAIALAWTVVLRPAIGEVGRLREAIALEEATLTRERAAIARARALGAEDDVAGDLSARVRPRLFAGRDDAIAGATLTAWVTDAADAHDVWVDAAVADSAVHGAGGLRTLTADVRAEGDVTGLVRLLETLEQGPYAVDVLSLEILARPLATATGGIEPLTLQFRVRGFAEGTP